MKIVGVYMVMGVALVVLQTTLLAKPLFHHAIYDLLLPVVIALRIHVSLKRGVFIVLVVGYMMDLVSGGQFGLYMTTYLWVFVGVKLASDYITIGETLALSVLLVACVLFENLILLVFSLGTGGGSLSVGHMAKPVFFQMALAAVTGPGVLTLLARMHQRLNGA